MALDGAQRPAFDEPEEWRAVPGLPLYEASSLGLVRSWAIRGSLGARASFPHVLRGYPGEHGHLRVSVGRGRRESVHVLVATAFIGPRGSAEVCRHLDGDPSNNRPGNLAWGSYVDNEADKRAHGRSLIGERHHQAILTEEDVRLVRSSALNNCELGRLLGVTHHAIWRIRKGLAWAHLLSR